MFSSSYSTPSYLNVHMYQITVTENKSFYFPTIKSPNATLKYLESTIIWRRGISRSYIILTWQRVKIQKCNLLQCFVRKINEAIGLCDKFLILY